MKQPSRLAVVTKVIGPGLIWASGAILTAAAGLEIKHAVDPESPSVMERIENLRDGFNQIIKALEGDNQ